MEIIFSNKAKEDLLFWKKSGNKGVQKKISELLEDISQHPFFGIGKPEELKGNLGGILVEANNKRRYIGLYHHL